MMNKKRLLVNIVWHMHQPFYWNEDRNHFVFPWVRTHLVKDYLFMPRLLSKFPGVKTTFNFSPVLLEQINMYAEGKKDQVLELMELEAGKLDNSAKEAIFKTFFLVASERVAQDLPRFVELRNKAKEGAEFSEQDVLDLQVLYQLLWFDPFIRKEHPQLSALYEKGCDYAEEDKRVILRVTEEHARKFALPYFELLDRNQIEVSVSPFYHPILPLLYNSNLALETTPQIGLPAVSFAYPEDAFAQVQMAVNFCRLFWQREPSGMWPSEGAVSEKIIPIFSQNGIRWVATGEEVLFFSLNEECRRDEAGVPITPEKLYTPYLVGEKGQEVAIFFRDRLLSDLIGFEYHKMPYQQAVEDLISRLLRIKDALPGDREYVVSIILDGENAWEFYEQNGLPFLSLLYERLSSEEGLATVTPREYLSCQTSLPRLKKLVAGSWIYGKLTTWIGHPEKNRAWEELAEVRSLFASKKACARDKEKALRFIYRAEGSDWFWWLGEDNPSPQKADFLNQFHYLLNKAKELL
jgi:alpha-amylase/alpha-mannosidase (GH57 family)